MGRNIRNIVAAADPKDPNVGESDESHDASAVPVDSQPTSVEDAEEYSIEEYPPQDKERL